MGFRQRLGCCTAARAARLAADRAEQQSYSHVRGLDRRTIVPVQGDYSTAEVRVNLVQQGTY